MTKEKVSPPKHSPDPIDLHVGARVKHRRSLLGITQNKLGEALGLSFQQVQKYERGTNRIGAGNLFRICLVLGIEPKYLFEGLPKKVEHDVRSSLNKKVGAPGFEEGEGANFQYADNIESEAIRFSRLWITLPEEVRQSLGETITYISRGNTPPKA